MLKRCHTLFTVCICVNWRMNERKRDCVRMKICFFTHLFWLLRVFVICEECTVYTNVWHINANVYAHRVDTLSVSIAVKCFLFVAQLACDDCPLWMERAHFASQKSNAAYLFLCVFTNDFCVVHILYLLGLSKRGLTNIGNYVSWLTFIAFATHTKKNWPKFTFAVKYLQSCQSFVLSITLTFFPSLTLSFSVLKLV